MGCFNGTCNVTNLPIFAGEKVALIPLVKIKEDVEFNTCYATDVFVPYALPLIGEYDEYGSIVNIETSEENKKHICNSFKYFFIRDSGSDNGCRYEPVSKIEDFEEFVSHVTTCHDGCYIKTNSSLYTDGMAEINFFMVHYDLYVEMIKEIGNRKIYDSEKTIESQILENIEVAISNTRSEFKLYNELQETINKNKENVRSTNHLYLIDNFKITSINDMSERLFKVGMFSTCINNWHDLSESLLNGNEKIINDVVNLQLFTRALDISRKGYLCDSGAGSQSAETKMHYVISKFIIKYIEKKDKNGYEEPSFS